MLVTAASGGSLLYDQCVPFAILKPKNRKTVTAASGDSLLYCQCGSLAILKPKNRKTEIVMEFTTQGGAFQVLLISALLHTSPKRIKESRIKNKRIKFCAMVCHFSPPPLTFISNFAGVGGGKGRINAVIRR